MFHIYNSTRDWWQATNQLYLSSHLERGGQKSNYLPFYIDSYPKDYYLLYSNEEVGVCGTAVLSPLLPYDFDHFDQIDFSFLTRTWTLKNIFFHLSAGHPLHEQVNKFQILVKNFYQGLFEQLWQLAQNSPYKMALSLQKDFEAHEDLKFFGGFTFQKEIYLEKKETVLGFIPLTPQAYQIYLDKKQEESFY